MSTPGSAPYRLFSFKIALWQENKALCAIIPVSWIIMVRQGREEHVLHDGCRIRWLEVSTRKCTQLCHSNWGLSSRLKIEARQLFCSFFKNGFKNMLTRLSEQSTQSFPGSPFSVDTHWPRSCIYIKGAFTRAGRSLARLLPGRFC